MPTKILAIDDSKTMRLAIKITFAAEDADVTSVSKGTDAVARAKQLGADVVLLDANLADGEPSGLEVCKQLKADDGTKSIPVILLVSNQSPPSASDISEAGADESIAKPFDTQDLIEKVAKVQGKEATKAVSSTPISRHKPAATPPSTARPAPVAPPPAAARPAAPAKPPMSPRPPLKPPASTPPGPAVTKQRVGATTEVGMPTPMKPAAAPAAAARPAPVAAPAGGAPADIPVAVPIPFTAASSPTPGMLERLQAAAGDSALDPKVAEALVNLSREVIERVVWEVVPELAESIVNERASAS